MVLMAKINLKWTANMHSTIRIRMIGGRGKDSFFIKSRLRSFVYDNVNDTNFLASVSRTKKYFNDDPNINDFQIKHFNYPITRYPRMVMAYNQDDGFMVGTGFWITRYGFRKAPYASDHELTALVCLSQKGMADEISWRNSSGLRPTRCYV